MELAASDWIAHIEDFTGRLAAVGETHDLQTPVPTCGDWTLAELLWHLLEVQTFWAHVIGTRPSAPSDYNPPVRPAAEDVAAGLFQARDRLLANLGNARAEEEAWSWADDHTVGFTLRRQTHESLVHLIDGLLAVGAEVPEIPAALAADGADEILRVMLAGVPEWATFAPGSGTLDLVATDTGDRWRIGDGRLTGLSPQGGNPVDAACYAFVDTEPDVTVAADALSLNLWLWRRGSFDTVEIRGDLTLASQLRETSAIL